MNTTPGFVAGCAGFVATMIMVGTFAILHRIEKLENRPAPVSSTSTSTPGPIAGACYPLCDHADMNRHDHPIACAEVVNFPPGDLKQ